MAVGYSHVGAVKVLLDAGASPEIPDNQGRNVVQLVDNIRSSMPYTPQLAGRRLALEEVAALLAGKPPPPLPPCIFPSSWLTMSVIVCLAI